MVLLLPVGSTSFRMAATIGLLPQDVLLQGCYRRSPMLVVMCIVILFCESLDPLTVGLNNWTNILRKNKTTIGAFLFHSVLLDLQRRSTYNI